MPEEPEEDVLEKLADGTVFYREPSKHEEFSNDFLAGLEVPLCCELSIDWLELSKQKYRLCQITQGDADNELNGLIELIDAIQLQADEKGLPVVWFRPDEDEDKPS